MLLTPTATQTPPTILQDRGPKGGRLPGSKSHPAQSWRGSLAQSATGGTELRYRLPWHGNNGIDVRYCDEAVFGNFFARYPLVISRKVRCLLAWGLVGDR